MKVAVSHVYRVLVFVVFAYATHRCISLTLSGLGSFKKFIIYCFILHFCSVYAFNNICSPISSILQVVNVFYSTS